MVSILLYHLETSIRDIYIMETHYGYKHHGYMHHGYMHHGYMHHGYMHHWHIHHGYICVGHTAWAPVGRKGRSQEAYSQKGLQLEVGARRAPRLLVLHIFHVCHFHFIGKICFEKWVNRDKTHWLALPHFLVAFIGQKGRISISQQNSLQGISKYLPLSNNPPCTDSHPLYNRNVVVWVIQFCWQ